MPRLDDLISRGQQFTNLDTGDSLSTVRDAVQSANAYLGAWPVVEALGRGANIIVTGRVTDTGLTLGPIIHEFGWRDTDWNRLASGTVAREDNITAKLSADHHHVLRAMRPRHRRSERY